MHAAFAFFAQSFTAEPHLLVVLLGGHKCGVCMEHEGTGSDVRHADAKKASCVKSTKFRIPRQHDGNWRAGLRTCCEPLLCPGQTSAMPWCLHLTMLRVPLR